MSHTSALPDASGGPLFVTGGTPERRAEVLTRSIIIALIAFLTLIDLFGSQALLPALVERYDASPAAMGFAVNASTIGMAIAGVVVAFFSRSINRKRWIWLSLAMLSIPTFLLGVTEDLTNFAILRVIQGFFMSAAFTLTLTYLSEVCSITAASGAMAAYITGNVASNLFGRLLASGIADNVGLSESFFSFAVLNFTGALIAFFYIGASDGKRHDGDTKVGSVIAAWVNHFQNPRLRASFVIGFIILFAFVGVFTYVNFILSGAPFSLEQSAIGLVYFVFLPSMLTTPLAGQAVNKYGVRKTFFGAMAVSLIGVLILLSSSLVVVMLGLAMIGAGLFFAQAVTTSYVGRTATQDHAAANGLYLSCYYVGGLTGALILGQVFVNAGWLATIATVAMTLVAGILLGRAFTSSES